jgi:Cu/Ag efflux protein CusF
MTLRTHSLLFIAVAAAAFSTHGLAQTDYSMHGSHTAMQMADTTDTQMDEGVVKKIDKAGARVTVSHGALKNGMPAMTMAYRVKDASWLDKLKPGQKIRFATDPADGGMTVLRFEPLK